MAEIISTMSMASMLEKKHKNITKTNKELFAAYNKAKQINDKTNSSKLREELIRINSPLVLHVVHKYYHNVLNHHDPEDLVQEGLIGLMNAIEAYDVEKGYQFSTYGTFHLKQQINQYLDREQTIHVPAHVKHAQNKLQREITGEKYCNNISQDEFYSKIQKIGPESVSKRSKEEITPRMVESVIRAMEARRIEYFEKDTENSLEHYDVDKIDYEKVFAATIKSFEKLCEEDKEIILLRFNLINIGQ